MHVLLHSILLTLCVGGSPCQPTDLVLNHVLWYMLGECLCVFVCASMCSDTLNSLLWQSVCDVCGVCLSVCLCVCVCGGCGCVRVCVFMSVCMSFQLNIRTCCVRSLGGEVGAMWNLKDPGN